MNTNVMKPGKKLFERNFFTMKKLIYTLAILLAGFTQANAQIANDGCDGAIYLCDGGKSIGRTGVNTNADNGYGAPCAPFVSRGQWFTFQTQSGGTPSKRVDIVITNNGSVNLQLVLLSGDCATDAFVSENSTCNILPDGLPNVSTFGGLAPNKQY